MTQIRTAVITGQRTLADALASRLAVEPDLLVVAIAESAAAARRLLAGCDVDIVLLDGGLAIDGLDLAAELAGIRAVTRQSVRLIMLGTVPEAPRTVELLRAGISAWVPKQESIEHLLRVIRGVMRDEYMAPDQRSRPGPPASSPRERRAGGIFEAPPRKPHATRARGAFLSGRRNRQARSR